MKRNWLLAAGVGGIALAVATQATDAPHDRSSSPAIGCTSCHTPHNAPGGSLTGVAGNANLCFSCHNQPSANTAFKWTNDHQAVPGVKGHSHAWSGTAVNSTHGAQLPQNLEMLKRLDGYTSNNPIRMTCSVCHDQHDNAYTSGLVPRSSIGVGVPVQATGPYAALKVASVSTTAAAMGYYVKVTNAGTATTAQFQVSNDGGGTWKSTTYTAGSSVDLGFGVSVGFVGTGNFAAGAAPDQWRFYVSYPFLRADNSDGQLCADCHRDRVQSADCVEGSAAAGDPRSGWTGTTYNVTRLCTAGSGMIYSHPTGPGTVLAQAYDRATSGSWSATAGWTGTPQVYTPLGTTQSTWSSNNTTSTSSFRLWGPANNEVRCMTCHYPHNADSNSLTEDAR